MVSVLTLVLIIFSLPYSALSCFGFSQCFIKHSIFCGCMNVVQNSTSSVLISMVYGVMNLNEMQGIFISSLWICYRKKNLTSCLYKIMRMI